MEKVMNKNKEMLIKRIIILQIIHLYMDSNLLKDKIRIPNQVKME